MFLSVKTYLHTRRFNKNKFYSIQCQLSTLGSLSTISINVLFQLTISYEKYDPDSDAMEQQRQTLHTISPKKCKLNQNQGSGSGSVSYLNKVKTLDDLDQYENSSSLQEKTIELVEDICKFQKDSENEIEKLEDLDQYENYNLPPLPALPTKTRPKKTAKSGTGASARIVPRQDCYENHDI